MSSISKVPVIPSFSEDPFIESGSHFDAKCCLFLCDILPCSVNAAYMSRKKIPGRGKSFTKTAKANITEATIQYYLANQMACHGLKRPFFNRGVLLFSWLFLFFPNKRSDIDNPVKAGHDISQGFLYENDNDIDLAGQMRFYTGSKKKSGYLHFVGRKDILKTETFFENVLKIKGVLDHALQRKDRLTISLFL